MNEIMELLRENAAMGLPFIQSPQRLAVSLLATALLTIVMLLTYRACHDTLTYNRKFNITLMMLAFISTILLALVQNNPFLSLGVLGSLSICRVRMNTRDPRDIGFVFWSLAIGLSSAVGAFLIGVLCTALLCVCLILFARTERKKDAHTVVVRGQRDQVSSVQEIFCKTPGSIAQAKNVFGDTFELVYQLKVSAQEEALLLDLFNCMEGIHGVNVLAPQSQVA